MRRLKTLSFLIVPWVVACVLAELTLVVFYPQPLMPKAFKAPMALHGFLKRKNKKVHYESSKGEFNTDFRYNPLGYREKDYNLLDKDNFYNIAFVGDSFVEAAELPAKESFIKAVETHLNKRSSQKRVRALNFGERGVGLDRYLEHIELSVSQYNPKRVVLVFYANDFPGSERHIFAKAKTFGWQDKLKFKFSVFGRKYSHLYTLLADRFIALRWAGKAPVQPMSIADKNEIVTAIQMTSKKSKPLLKKYFAHLSNRLQKKNIKLSVTYMPSAEEIESSQNISLPGNILKQVLEPLNVSFVDLYGTLKDCHQPQKKTASLLEV